MYKRQLHIGVNTFALGVDAFFREQINHHLCGQDMVGVRPGFQDVFEIEQLELLMFRSWHVIPPCLTVYYKIRRLTSIGLLIFNES